MSNLLGLIGILGGMILILSGLLMIAPQIRVHQIAVYSRGSWLYRVGMILVGCGVLLTDIRQLEQVGWLMGVTGMTSGIITWGHERAQAHDRGEKPWFWGKSLTLQMVILGAIIFGLAISS